MRQNPPRSPALTPPAPPIATPRQEVRASLWRRGWFGGGLAAILLSITAAPATGNLPMSLERTHPDHFKGQPQPPLPEMPAAPERWPRLEPKMLYRFPDTLSRFAAYDPVLSDLCRSQAFRQQINGFFYANTPDRRFGVAFGNGANLYDFLKRRQTETVYFFENQDTSRCVVLTARLDAVAGHKTYATLAR